jgi:hypothetical protein
LKFDAAKHRHGFLRRKLVGDRPSRRSRYETKLALPRELVDLVDDAVDVVRQRGTSKPDPAEILEATGDALDEGGFRASGKPELAQQLDDPRTLRAA